MKDLIINLFNKFRYTPSLDMKGMVIVIFGASGKIGKVLTNYFLEKGAKLALFGRDMSKLKNILNVNYNDKVILYSGDISNEHDLNNFIINTKNKFGNINAVINTVGLFSELNIEEINSKSIDQMCDSNFKSVVIPSKVAMLNLSRGSTIVNFGSYIVKNKNIGSSKSLYLAFKSALDGFSRVFTVEAKKYGIRVVCVEPATVSNFISKDFLKYINPYSLAELIEFILKFKDIDFGVLPFKSVKQNI